MMSTVIPACAVMCLGSTCPTKPEGCPPGIEIYPTHAAATYYAHSRMYTEVVPVNISFPTTTIMMETVK